MRINCLGLLDVVGLDSGKNVAAFQQDDLLALGQLMICLACGSLQSGQNPAKAVDFIARQYSNDFKTVIVFLLSKPSPMKSIDNVVSMTAQRLVAEMDSARW